MVSEKQTSLQFDRNHKRNNQGLWGDFNKMWKLHYKVFAYSDWQGASFGISSYCTFEAVRSFWTFLWRSFCFGRLCSRVRDVFWNTGKIFYTSSLLFPDGTSCHWFQLDIYSSLANKNNTNKWIMVGGKPQLLSFELIKITNQTAIETEQCGFATLTASPKRNRQIACVLNKRTQWTLRTDFMSCTCFQLCS